MLLFLCVSCCKEIGYWTNMQLEWLYVHNCTILAKSFTSSKLDISPVPANKKDSSSELMGSFILLLSYEIVHFTANRAFTFEVRYCRFSVSITKHSGIASRLLDPSNFYKAVNFAPQFLAVSVPCIHSKFDRLPFFTMAFITWYTCGSTF